MRLAPRRAPLYHDSGYTKQQSRPALSGGSVVTNYLELVYYGLASSLGSMVVLHHCRRLRATGNQSRDLWGKAMADRVAFRDCSRIRCCRCARVSDEGKKKVNWRHLPPKILVKPYSEIGVPEVANFVTGTARPRTPLGRSAPAFQEQ